MLEQLEAEIALGKRTSVIAIVDALITTAYHRRASDIHIDPYETYIRICFRIDGVLEEIIKIPKEIHSELVSRVKIQANLRIDEHHTPQDGRFRTTISDSLKIDVRVSILPTYYGENVVMRLLKESVESQTLQTLAISNHQVVEIEKAISKGSGMILATGPTGSGKTTTLYTILKKLNTGEQSIVTIEDPVEYAIEGVRQIQVNSQKHITFATGLRSIVRQDPDTILVGEIRDKETAHIAIHAALTGHLLLSTLHTNSAAAAIPRLLDMGIEAYLLASTLEVIIAQRLVRKLCTACKQQRLLNSEEWAYLCSLHSPFEDCFGVYEPSQNGCSHCNFTGFYGRVLISETLVVSPAIQQLILERASSHVIENQGQKLGMKTILQDGLEKVMQGTTSIQEVIGVLQVNT